MKVLLHICCAPCSIMCIETLRNEGIEPVGFWDNVNIHPYTEYRERKNTLVEYAKSISLELIVHGEYGLRPFVKEVAEDIDGRCVKCYRMRFRTAAQYAAENGFTHFTSTLFVSPYQNHELMIREAEAAAAEFGVQFLHRDFRPWFREGQDKARELGLYMQKYCGCVFSEEDRYKKRKKSLSRRHRMLDYLKMHLETRWAGRGEIAYEPVMDSTNIRAKAMARAGAPHGSLAVCDHQTAGRGRMTRRWETPAGEALTQTVVLRPSLPVEQAQLCTFAAALAAAKAIEEVCPELKPCIKWPNDVVIGSRKCVGILCEMVLDANGYAVAAGVGININQTSFEGELSDKATSLLMETGKTIDRSQVLCAYLRHLENAVDALEKSGLSGILPEYLGRSVTIGSRVRVVGTNEEFTGTAKAVDETGALIVEDETGADRRVLSGDVSVRGLMGYVD